MTVLGKSAQELNPLIEAGGERMTELGEQAQAAGYVLSGDTLNAYGELDDQLQYLKVGADAAKNALGTILMPALTELATDGVSMLGDFTNGIKNANGDWGEIGEVIGGAVEGILEKVNEFLPQLTEVAVGMITAITTGIADNTDGILESAMQIMTTLLSALTELLPMLIDVAGQLLFALADGLLTNLPMIVESALQVVLTLAEGISEALPELVPRIVEVVVQIVSTLLENVPMLIEAALSIILALAQGIEEALPELAAAVPQIISSIVTAIIASLPELLPAAVDIIFSLIDGILGALPELIAMVPNIIIGIIQGLLDNLEQIILFAPEIITALITGLIGAIPELIMALPRVIMSIVDTFRDYDWGSIGTNLMEGLIEGIGGMAAKVIMKIYEVAKGIYDEICDFFGIHSPSTLFADIGGYLLEGLWNGIADMKRWLVDKIRSLGSSVTEALKSVLGIHSPSTVFETQIGKNLALGLGVGFEKAMRTVRDDMAQAVPTDFDIDADVNASLHGRDTKTSDCGVTVILNIDTFNNNTDSDIHDLADELSVILAAKLSRKDAVFA